MRMKIVWEKWNDPLTEPELPGNDDDGDDDDDEGGWNDNPVHLNHSKMMPVLHTPMGLMGVNNQASSQFDFWVMHTNFDITEGFVKILEQLPGVETLDVFTRYRLRIGFSKAGLFDVNDVKARIGRFVTRLNRSLQDEMLTDLNEDVAQSVANVRDDLDDKYEHWCVLVLPNGNTEIACSAEMNNVYKKNVAALRSVQSSVGGICISPDIDYIDDIL
jgi:hypothetical protein